MLVETFLPLKKEKTAVLKLLGSSIICFIHMGILTFNGMIIEMKGITRCKLTIISESAVCKIFLGQIWSYAASL